MASESNATLHNAMRLHIDNLRLLAKPLDELQKEIPSMADLDDASEANIAEVCSFFTLPRIISLQKLWHYIEIIFKSQNAIIIYIDAVLNSCLKTVPSTQFKFIVWAESQ
jgi:hypothetical protein